MDDDLKKVLDKQIDILFRLTHHKVFRIQLQTLKLLFQFAKTSNRLVNTQDAGDPEAPASTFADRFYRTLYEFILKTHGQKSMDDYFGLLFRAIKADKCVTRVIAFVRRLLQMCLVNEANFTAATLLVISEVLNTRPDARFELFQNKPQEKVTETVISKEAVQSSDDEDEERF